MKVDPTLPAQADFWLAAARRLGFRANAPYEFVHEHEAFQCVVHLPDFGGTNGMLVRNHLLEDSLMKAARAAHFGFSHVSVQSTDDDGFIEMLSDWTWTGSGPAPTWLRE